MNNNNTYQEFDEQLMYMYTQTRFYDEDDSSSVEGELIQVAQHLSLEQYQYEFPTKMRLKQLAYLDDDNMVDSYFDESSFMSESTTTITSTALSSDKQQTSDYFLNSHMLWHETLVEEEEQEDDLLVEDNKLSPLQLPAQVISTTLSNNASTETITQSQKAKEERPVGPSSFLSDAHMYNHVTPRENKGYSDLLFDQDYASNESVPIMDTDIDSSTTTTTRSTESRIVLIKLNKCKKESPQSLLHHSTSLTYISNDEGYDDDLDDDELESHCVFYPLVEDENDSSDVYMDYQRDRAAIKIQSLWRGYISRRNNLPSLKAEQRVVINLAQFCGRLHRRQMNSVDQRLAQLEQRVQEETAMRMAFEKAMEDMTVLIDQQQKILYDRLEQEVHMRQLYETKMNTALKQLQPLETKLKKEVAARNKMEDMMTRVLDQMHESETARQQQAKEDAESKKLMQIKLEQAIDDIATIKKQQTTTVNTRRTTATATTATATTTTAQKPLLNKNNNNSARTTVSSTTTASSRVTSSSSIRKSIVPVTNNATTLRRSQPSSQAPLYERPSVIPSNRRPLTSSTTKQRIQTTTTTPRRPLLTRS